MDLAGRELTHVPEIMAKLNHITGLKLDNNYLTELPLWIKNFGNLTRLEIQDNKFRELPSCIIRLKNLKYLDVSDNKLNRLPKELGGLCKLKELDISNNAITDLPEIIDNLPVHIRLISKEETDNDGSFGYFDLGELDRKSQKISHLSLYDSPIVYTITHEYATVPKRQKQESPPPHGEM